MSKNRAAQAEEIKSLVDNATGPISLAEAANILGYGSSRAVAARIAAAWWYYDSIGDRATQATIARTFIDRRERFPWA